MNAADVQHGHFYHLDDGRTIEVVGISLADKSLFICRDDQKHISLHPASQLVDECNQDETSAQSREPGAPNVGVRDETS